MDKEKLLELYPSYTSVLGPYTRNDGRKHIVLNNSNLPKGNKGKNRTISYPKALKEIALGKRLLPDETIDHHDRNVANDCLTNLKVKPLYEHASEDSLRIHVDPILCPICSVSFVPTIDQRNKMHNGVRPAGPFCSKRCAGVYGNSIRNGAEKIQRTEINKTYYRLEK